MMPDQRIRSVRETRQEPEAGDVTPATSWPVRQTRREDVDRAEKPHDHTARRPARRGPRTGTRHGLAVKVGVLALLACTVAELAIAASTAGPLTWTFWSHPDQAPKPTPAIAAPPLPASSPPQAQPDTPVPEVTPPPLTQEQVTTLHIWLTGYSFQDNTPPGSAIVSAPVLHRKAGGTGTYADPITVAVSGHADERTMAWHSGTRFYLPTVQRYVIVEDSGASPAPPGQDGHLDMWVDGEGGSKAASDRCMDQITGVGIPAIMNPPPDGPVMPGPITSGGTCRIPTDTN